MKIGVVSDTHNNLPNVKRIVELFNAAQVERVIHTGDITQAKTLDMFAQLTMPLYGVFGNNDQERDSLDEAIARHGFTGTPRAGNCARRRATVRKAGPTSVTSIPTRPSWTTSATSGWPRRSP